MTDHADDCKSVKKAAKAASKAEKKKAKAEHATTHATAGPMSEGPTPAERSAAAAEKQVRLQRWRVTIAILTFLIAAVTLFITQRGRFTATPEPPPAESVNP